jgi:hypothetical protein
VETNPAWTEYVQAQHHADADRRIIREFEEFTAKHQGLLDDAAARIDRGGNWATPQDHQFVATCEQVVAASPEGPGSPHIGARAS